MKHNDIPFKALAIALLVFIAGNAYAGLYSSTSTPSNCAVEIWYKNALGSNVCQSVNFNKAKSGRVPLAISPGSYATLASDHWILHLCNVYFQGYISSGAGVEIQLEGTNTIFRTASIGYNSEKAIYAGGGLSIVGPGSLTVFHTYGGAAIYAERGDFSIREGASVEVEGWNDSPRGIFSYNNLEIADSIVRVYNSGNGLGGYDFGATGITAYGNISIKNSLVSVASVNNAIETRNGLDIDASCVHAMSAKASGVSCSGIESASIRNSVFSSYGNTYGFQMSGVDNDPWQSLSFSRVAGAIVGRRTGIFKPNNLHFTNSDLLVAGNTRAENGIDWTFAGDGLGIFIRQINDVSQLRQQGGAIRVAAPGNIGVRAPRMTVGSGTFEIGADITSSDIEQRFGSQTAEAALSIVAEEFPFRDALSLLDGWTDESMLMVLPDGRFLPDSGQGLPRIGHAGIDTTVSGGKVSIAAASTGILLGYRDSGGYKGGTLTVAGGDLSVSSSHTAVAGWACWEGSHTHAYSTGAIRKESDIAITGGSALFKGATNAVLLAGSVLQTGGTLQTVVTSPISGVVVSGWPCCLGGNIVAGGGFTKTGGTFRHSGGTLASVPNGVRLVFNANGGTVGVASKVVEKGTAAGALPTPARSGWMFVGWYTAASGGTKVAATTKITASRTLYARWAKKNYKVAFHANGGTLPKGKKMAAQTMTWGKAAKLRKNAFVRKDCAFRGWATSKGGKVVYKNAQSVKNLRTDGKTTTLYAKWAKKTYTVAFNANGGKGTMAKQTMTWGKAAKLRKNAFKRKGWKFIGWSTKKNGAVAYKNAQAVKNLRTDGKTTTLYAVWQKTAAKASKAVGTGTAVSSGEPWAVVTTCDKSDGTAVVDGDETTAWSPETAGGSWVVLSFADVRNVADVEVAGENLPEGTRILLSEDADGWQEGVPGKAQYVWVLFPAAEEPPVVREIRVEEE